MRMLGLDYSGPEEFVHLHCHTVYSTLDGVQTPENLFARCAERKWPAVAITEHGHLSSVPDNYFASKTSGVQYIPGCEIYYNDYEPLRQQMQADGEKLSILKQSDPMLYSRIMRNRHITVLAKNMTGFHNLVKMTTEAWKFGYYSRPRVWFEKLMEYKEGLIILTGCFNGPISHELNIHNMRDKNHKGAVDYALKLKEAFGDDCYIEIQMPCIIEGDKDDRKVFWLLNAISRKFGIPAVLTNDVHYVNREDFQTQKLMMAIGQNVTVDSPDLFNVNTDEQFLKTRADLYTTFIIKGYSVNSSDTEFEQACDTTLEVASKCELFNPNTDPKIPTNDGDVAELKRLVASELVRRGLHNCDKKYIVDNRLVTYKDQLKIELDRLIEKGFASYFLITKDLIQFSLKNGYPVGPRGSVGGSLVCFLLGIHELDPLKWGLSFDRFLSPSRGGYMLNIRAE
jgi:DNA polymerase-3 subunit alpha